MPQQLCILGSTGSIGVNTLEVAALLGLQIHSLSAHDNWQALAQQARDCHPKHVVISNEAHYQLLKEALSDMNTEVLAGAQALVDIAGSEANDVVMTAIVGAAGLAPTLAAVATGKRVCIANKEPLVMAGSLIMQTARQSGAECIPVDSEHSAIFQCLQGHQDSTIRSLILTGSGGPFRTHDDLSQVTKEAALKHPNWSMGPKITIDSATLMNKALEIVEARWLFDVDPANIELWIHPESVVHSMVNFADGSLMAQLGLPDMRTPIQYSLTYPLHQTGPVPSPRLSDMAQLQFEAPKRDVFPSVDLGFHVASTTGCEATIMNAANEVAVEQFLSGKRRFIDIFNVIEQALNECNGPAHPNLDDILAIDHDVRMRYGS